MSFVSGLHLKFTINVWVGLPITLLLDKSVSPGLRWEVLGRMGKNRTLIQGEFRAEDLS